ncbi:MAG: acyl-ACP--UDP-N-acetylglucosamine O-acyltransferase [Pedosphaera sp.]|nr:acyl-ACP--UDP-N-acetylglucosamine O-acyltransferase [Pedosphaera sp.]
MADTQIHRTAVVHPEARLGNGVVVGPLSVVEEHVTLGAGCILGPQVIVTGHTVVGARNRFHAGAVVGDAPQDFKYAGSPTRLRIGDDNVFREHVTIHRSNTLDDDTVIGSGNLFMVGSHAGHNCVVGNQNIFANGSLLAGHVTVADRAFISGNCLVHQFTRIGRLAMMQGGSAISRDLPPFCVARGDNGICGLNVVGLRRLGFDSAQRLELRALYHLLFRSQRKLADLLLEARGKYLSGPAQEMIDFVAGAQKGVCRDTGKLEISDE